MSDLEKRVLQQESLKETPKFYTSLSYQGRTTRGLNMGSKSAVKVVEFIRVSVIGTLNYSFKFGPYKKVVLITGIVRNGNTTVPFSIGARGRFEPNSASVTLSTGEYALKVYATV